jgi:hypothetical protein
VTVSAPLNVTVTVTVIGTVVWNNLIFICWQIIAFDNILCTTMLYYCAVHDGLHYLYDCMMEIEIAIEIELESAMHCTTPYDIDTKRECFHDHTQLYVD